MFFILNVKKLFNICLLVYTDKRKSTDKSGEKVLYGSQFRKNVSYFIENKGVLLSLMVKMLV